MFKTLPSLLQFQPKYFVGSPARFHLAFLYDLVALARPASIVALGFGEGEAFFTLCQAVRESSLSCQCTAVYHRDEGEAVDNSAWRDGEKYCEEFYGDFARLLPDGPDAQFAQGSVDLLFVNDLDCGSEIEAELLEWQTRLTARAVVLVHGTELERADSPKSGWRRWIAQRSSAEFAEGIGLGVAWYSKTRPGPDLLFEQLFAGKNVASELAEIYHLVTARIEAQARAEAAERDRAALEARQVWIDSLLADRWKVQEIMDHQRCTIESQTENFEILRRDRAKAQLVMDAQAEQLKDWNAMAHQLETERVKLKAQVREQKQILDAAKTACRKKGRCFQIPGAAGERKRRSIPERILREIKRAPRNLLGRGEPSGPKSKSKATPKVLWGSESMPETGEPADRYAAWIAEHEPDEATLERQSTESVLWARKPKISLLVPVLNTPAKFLEAMFSSVAKQTYRNWELCLVDAGSTQAETLKVLDSWVAREPRIRLERLEVNLGIAENTNRALKLATGEFIACLDHDDLLAPFALYEIARAISSSAAAEVFYSEEDRWSEKDRRHAPFFKPEWSPELLYSSMYLGHLTVYRRDLVDALGGFRNAFDLSQDYDFALRATERAQAVCHVPHVLYHWREHPGSGSTGGKPEARKTNLAALADAMERRGLAAEIIEYPTANRVRLKISEWPKVSIIVPTDSAARSRLCVEQLPQMTSYPNYEIVIVTNSALAEVLEVAAPKEPGFRFVRYDKPFNFSDKCNLGAQAATGERVVIVNDDVETPQPDWLQNLIEPLENPEVGAVAPKLLYATGRIQHAGLVTGVRGLVGTAFHQLPADTTAHANFAQSMRDVSALSGACLAMRRDDFFRVEGFDAENTPVSHSDIDLCFKVREAGLRCVYTPFATLTHVGHVSIAGEEMKPSAARLPDKSSIHLLKRWGGYVTRDPFYTENMRDWLYADSPTPIRMFGKNNPKPPRDSRDLLFVSHDLSLSGAPMMLFHAARWCQQNGIFVLVMALKDGPLREKLEAEAIPLIIDPLIATGHNSFAKFARNFDLIVANTIRSAAAVNAMQNTGIPVAWWIHEPGSVGGHYLREDTKLRAALPMAAIVFAPSERTAAFYRPFTDRPVVCLRNAIPDVAQEDQALGTSELYPLRFLMLGSIEPRKGQDVFVQAIAALPLELQQAGEFHMLGRIMDPKFGARIAAAAGPLKNVSIDGPRNHQEALEAVRGIDVLVCSSRDEAMPVTILEALSLGKAIISTNVGGIGEILTEGHEALLVRPEDPEALAVAMQRLLEDPELARKLGRNARATFEKNFTMDRFGADFRKLVADVVAQTKSSGQSVDACGIDQCTRSFQSDGPS
jgi:GT2 family glycosyltransferase